MHELEQQARAARDLLDVPTSHADTERALARFKDLGRRRKRRRIVAGAVGSTIAAIAIAWLVLPKSTPPVETPELEAPVAAIDPPAKPEVAEEENRVIYFPDGSHAFLLKPHTLIRMEALSDDLLELTMTAGEARFDVQPNPQRLFRVRTDDLRIEVLGTSFTVAEAPESTRVTVHRGRVAVYQGGNRHELGPNMTFTFDGDRAVVEGQEREERADRGARPAKHKKHRAKKQPKKRSVDSVDHRWKSLAEQGDYNAAYQAMSGGKSAVEDDTTELMLAADVARLTGHPREAAGYLEQVVAKHRAHPRALLAAFTLGRIRQHELDDPLSAAAAFHDAYSLAPSGSLAEDALAHEVECWAQAGAKDQAKARATEYLERYPNGRKQKQVRRMGGL